MLSDTSHISNTPKPHVVVPAILDSVKQNTYIITDSSTGQYWSGEQNSKYREKIPYDITNMWNLKYETNELIYKTETENKLVVTKEERRSGGGINQEFGISRYTQLSIK